MINNINSININRRRSSINNNINNNNNTLINEIVNHITHNTNTNICIRNLINRLRC